jgi:CRP-like cAMP-binding protein
MGEQNLFERFGRTFPTGTVLFQEGESGEEMYVIQAGRVQLTRQVRGSEVHLATLPPGEFFGEMAILNRRPRTATATVIDDAQLLVIDARTFEAMVRGNAEIAVRFIKKLAARLEQSNAQVEVLLLADLNHRIVHLLRHLAEVGGIVDGPSLRIEITAEQIAEQVGAQTSDVRVCLKRLEQARLVSEETGAIRIAEVGKLDQFLEFLEMKQHFGE